jgi:glycosyltransferase involved in cell wall biosynthesis
MIAVIIPNYKHEAYLMVAIESIKRQTFTDWMIIILNDDPDVDLRGIERPSVRIIQDGKHLGQAARLNQGIEEAKKLGCNLIAFQDADDMSDSERFELSVNFMKKHTLDAVYGNMISFYPDGRKVLWKSPEWDPDRLATRAMGCFGSVMVKTDKIVPFDPKVGYGNDWIWWATMALTGVRIGKIDLPLYYYRIGTSNFNKKSRMPGRQKFTRLWRKFWLNRRIKRMLEGRI